MKYKKYIRYTNYILKSIPKLICKRKVDFLICGTQKGGTTALYKYLKKHNEIGIASKKEVHFFDNDKLFFRNKSFYPIYHSFFNFKENCKVFGEATPIYMFWEQAPVRIWKYNPEMKLIIILRNPIERAYSHWNMKWQKNITKVPFLETVKSDNNPRNAYINRGFYVEQIERIWNYFPKEQTLILKNESLRKTPKNTLNKIYEFLGVSLIDNIESRNVHSRRYSKKMSCKEKEYLLNIYKDEIMNLEKLLGWDCSDWLTI